MKQIYFCGSGIKSIGHLTKETIACIQKSDVVLFLLNEPLTCEWVKSNSKKHIDLSEIYFKSTNRKDSYQFISDFIINECLKYNTICIILYGNPFYCASPALDTYKKLAHMDDINLKVMPAVSSFDCLYNDLAFDPTIPGTQIYEATYFIDMVNVINPSAYLVLNQISFIKTINHQSSTNIQGVNSLVHKLSKFYPLDHKILIYSATLYDEIDPVKISEILNNLHLVELDRITTLVIPPVV